MYTNWDADAVKTLFFSIYKNTFKYGIHYRLIKSDNELLMFVSQKWHQQHSWTKTSRKRRNTLAYRIQHKINRDKTWDIGERFFRLLQLNGIGQTYKLLFVTHVLIHTRFFLEAIKITTVFCYNL